MAEEGSSKLLKVSGKHTSKSKIKYANKYKRNRNRNLRRKRSKSRYFENIRNLRSQRRSQELCGTLSVFNITDMEYSYNGQLLKPPREVTEWQYQHQLAYWKSRAISLEYENRMLHAYIKKMCTQEIQDYVDYVKDQENIICSADNDVSARLDDDVKEDLNETSDENASQNNQEKLYGEMQSKINGMETAMRVNYDMQVEKHKPQMWPNIPLNL